MSKLDRPGFGLKFAEVMGFVRAGSAVSNARVYYLLLLITLFTSNALVNKAQSSPLTHIHKKGNGVKRIHIS